MFRDHADLIYDAMAELTGRLPEDGERIYFGVDHRANPKGSRSPIEFGAYTWADSNMIYFYDDEAPHSLRTVTKNNVASVLPHEIAHNFTQRKIGAEYESFANILLAYVLETIDGVNFIPNRPDSLEQRTFKETEYREVHFNSAVQQFRNGRIQPFSPVDDKNDSAYDFYLFGLVDKVGWDVYRQVMHSYEDPNYERNWQVRLAWDSSPSERAKEFFVRVGLFHGDLEVLFSLPDNGSLIQRFFPQEYAAFRARTR
jgi:hypothetical protein